MSATSLCVHVQEGKLEHVYWFDCCDRYFKTYHSERFAYCPFCGENVSMTHQDGMRWF